jgi:PAS domain S-box-containing protein
MQLKLKLLHKGIILVTLPLLVNLGFLAVLSQLLHESEIEIQKQMRSKDIVVEANSLSTRFFDAGVAMAGYSVTRSPKFGDRYQEIAQEIPETLNRLRTLVAGNVAQTESVDRLQGITDGSLHLLQQAKLAIDENQADSTQFSAHHMYKEIRSNFDKLKAELKIVTEEARKIEEQSPEQRDRVERLVKLFIVFGIGANVVLTFAMALLFMQGINQKLQNLIDNAGRLARGGELNAPLQGEDELAVVDESFHTMAEALAEANRKERAIIDNAADIICSVDINGKFVAVSPACLTIWGYSPDELIGKRFVEMIAPDDLDSTIKAVRAVRARLTTMSFESRVRRRDGVIIDMLWSAYWSEAEQSVFCVAHDITQRKKAEEAIKASERRIRTLIENMMVALVILTKDGYIEAVNPSAERIFGYRADDMVGKHFSVLFKSESDFANGDGQKLDQFMEKLLEADLNRISEHECLKRTGAELPVELSLTEFQTPEGMRYMANILDVSERKEVERLKKEFVSTVSHELRTPLTSIRGSLTLLNVGAGGALPDKAKEMVGLAERNTLRLINLINDILDIEKLESGKLDMVFANVSMDQILERSAEAVRAFVLQHGVELQVKPSSAKVYADGDRLVQVIVNLVSNAVKFSPKGETVTVVAQETTKWLEVKVIDHGRGIPEHYQSLLFQRFQQVETADSRKKGGTGLGLAICKGIIEQHGGTIGVDSEEGKGSEFWFRIPLRQL